mgnify:CR=1 FL=1|tara:strand:+ start:4244 stop:4675 length:432 start_codon:yes stop_codon:yes gene_type:complete
MPRRASSGISTGQIIGLVAGVVFILVIMFVMALVLMKGNFLGDGESRPPTASSELNLDDYMNNANSMRGNAYRVTGKVEEQLKWTPSRGRLYSVTVTQGTRSPIPILIPQSFSHVNIEKGSEFTFVVEVGNDGVLIAREIKQG